MVTIAAVRTAFQRALVMPVMSAGALAGTIAPHNGAIHRTNHARSAVQRHRDDARQTGQNVADVVRRTRAVTEVLFTFVMHHPTILQN